MGNLTKAERKLLQALARKQGVATGAAGGRKAAQNMTAAQRTARARNAAAARYGKEAANGEN